MFVIVYRLKGHKTLYHGKTKPVTNRNSAIKFATAESACYRLRQLGEIKDFSPELISNASVEKI